MANRCYLYSTNIVPGPDAKANGRKLVGIAEWNYDVPIIFKLLVSADPRTCLSSIWGHAEEIALVGDYARGVENLEAFLSQVNLPEAQGLVAEAIEFLGRPENRSTYFVLECGEIFDMGDAPLLAQNLALLEEVKNLQPVAAQALQSIAPSPVATARPAGFFSRLLGRAPEPAAAAHDPMQSIHALGLGNWSNALYYDFSDA